MADEITLWLPEQDRHRLALFGKLIEECNELSARAARCITQGLDELDPKSGRPNRDELTDEIADVEACFHMLGVHLDIKLDLRRSQAKVVGFHYWHRLLDEAAANGQAGLEAKHG